MLCEESFSLFFFSIYVSNSLCFAFVLFFLFFFLFYACECEWCSYLADMNNQNSKQKKTRNRIISNTHVVRLRF